MGMIFFFFAKITFIVSMMWSQYRYPVNTLTEITFVVLLFSGFVALISLIMDLSIVRWPVRGKKRKITLSGFARMSLFITDVLFLLAEVSLVKRFSKDIDLPIMAFILLAMACLSCLLKNHVRKLIHKIEKSTWDGLFSELDRQSNLNKALLNKTHNIYSTKIIKFDRSRVRR